MRKNKPRFLNKRALSPIFATLILAAIVITFGTVTYYYASNVTKTATNNFVDSAVNAQQSLSERVDFENFVYTTPQNPSTSGTLKFFVINSGIASNLKINSVFLYDANHKIKGVYSMSDNPSTISVLSPIDGGTPIPGNILNAGKEGIFILTLGKDSSGTFINLVSGVSYTVHLVTQSGATFDYEITLKS